MNCVEGCGGVPPIRPLETLHNALSLRQIDSFLERMARGFKTPASTPPRQPGSSRPTSPSAINNEGSEDERYFYEDSESDPHETDTTVVPSEDQTRAKLSDIAWPR
ncbi:unnamed protein product, partial [Nesidiocoris tenuis]